MNFFRYFVTIKFIEKIIGKKFRVILETDQSVYSGSDPIKTPGSCRIPYRDPDCSMGAACL